MCVLLCDVRSVKLRIKTQSGQFTSVEGTVDEGGVVEEPDKGDVVKDEEMIYEEEKATKLAGKI